MIQSRGFNINTQNLKQEYDYIIVGQGLAGSCLALELMEKGKTVMVFNDSNGNSSSRVAGGLINPITGRKMVLTWRANQLFPFLKRFYRNTERKLGTKFYHEIPIYRPFISVEEQNEWQGKSAETNYNPFVKKVVTKSEKEQVVVDPFGGLLLNGSGYLDTIIFLEAVNSWLEKDGMLVNEKFDFDSLNFIDDEVVYKNIKAKKVIFCNGVEIIQSNYFKEVKFRPVKGEVLKIAISPTLNKVYNRGVFIMPRNGSHTVGSNYNHKDLSWEKTEKARAEIEVKLQLLLLKEYKILDHKAGVRPSVSDRRPVLGSSSKNEQLIIFNGLGTKGVSLAPFFANQLANNLINGTEIEKEVNVNRFY
ncbi:FAD-dependent cmnm(5)s(2)U34 oxidoreductase [hydrothermal vent metagenome]|uniref:FAD-dependent cmnm(5)s(2)U34 oxidoreductase n=1 Tax=hydrothermal vent metagenome TaxID=652676 RepID=A0A3B0UA61_9ZZZZ